jgi:hypothetical protein
MTSRARRILLPAGTFVIVLAIHYVWTGLFPERDPAQDRWVSAPAAEISWFRRYVETQSYWMGYSYSVALTFAVVALRRYQENRLCGARNLAIGGVTLSGFLAVAGCFLLGCCGSPMLAVYLSLFGASFLPFAKPLVAGITSITILAGWFWLNRRSPARALNTAPSTDPACHCD